MKNTKDKQKIYRVYVPHIIAYATKPRKITPWYKAVKESIYKNKLVESFSTDIKHKIGKKLKSEVTFGLPPKIEKELELAQKRGEKIEFIYPKKGIPIYPSRCLTEKIKSIKRKNLTHKR